MQWFNIVSRYFDRQGISEFDGLDGNAKTEEEEEEEILPVEKIEMDVFKEDTPEATVTQMENLADTPTDEIVLTLKTDTGNTAESKIKEKVKEEGDPAVQEKLANIRKKLIAIRTDAQWDGFLLYCEKNEIDLMAIDFTKWEQVMNTNGIVRDFFANKNLYIV